MSKFVDWLVENGHVESPRNIEGQLSGSEADYLYSVFLGEGLDDEDDLEELP